MKKTALFAVISLLALPLVGCGASQKTPASLLNQTRVWMRLNDQAHVVTIPGGHWKLIDFIGSAPESPIDFGHGARLATGYENPGDYMAIDVDLNTAPGQNSWEVNCRQNPAAIVSDNSCFLGSVTGGEVNGIYVVSKRVANGYVTITGYGPSDKLVETVDAVAVQSR